MERRAVYRLLRQQQQSDERAVCSHGPVLVQRTSMFDRGNNTPDGYLESAVRSSRQKTP